MSDLGRIRKTLAVLLHELVEGASPEPSGVLNPNDPGLLRSLDRLSAEAASRRSTGGGATIAAHVDHVRYGLSLMNRWMQGEDPFRDADYSASWEKPEVSANEWVALRRALRDEIQAWMTVVERPRELTDVELTGMVASVVHLAYHLGAIRQIDRGIGGPSARD